MSARFAPDGEIFCERLRRLREAKGLSVAEVARRIGVTHSVVGRAENGDQMVRAARLEPLARMLGVSIDYLMTGREIPKVAALHNAIRRGESRDRLLAMIAPQFEEER